jgi:hypothetical protein
MRTRNWQQYNRFLVQQGSLSFFIDPKVLRSRKNGKRRGRPVQFSDPLIQMLFMIKIRFRLPYRALEGFVKSLFQKNKTGMPTYSLICKRVGHLKLALPIFSSKKPLTVILDASGVKVCGEGEWKVKIHGKGRPRQWVKLHIAIDADTQEIVAECTTEGKTADSSMVKNLLRTISNRVRLVIADGAYDRRGCRDAIKQVKAKSLIPLPKNARYRFSNSERDQAIVAIRGLGGDKEARSVWGKLSGYSRRALVETAFSRFKRHFGDRLFSHRIDKQRIENTARCLLLNQMIS